MIKADISKLLIAKQCIQTATIETRKVVSQVYKTTVAQSLSNSMNGGQERKGKAS